MSDPHRAELGTDGPEQGAEVLGVVRLASGLVGDGRLRAVLRLGELAGGRPGLCGRTLLLRGRLLRRGRRGGLPACSEVAAQLVQDRLNRDGVAHELVVDTELVVL